LKSSQTRSLKIKILAYVHRYRGMNRNAGGEVSIHALLRHLNAAGHQCVALVAEPTEAPSYHLDGVGVITTNSPAEIKAAPVEYFHGADVVVTQLNSSYRAGILGRMVGTPVVHYAHNTGPFTTRMVGGQCDAAIYNTEWVRRHCESQGIWTPGEILRPVVDPAEYATPNTRARRHITLVNLSTGDDGLYDKGYQTFFELARRNPDLPFLAVRGAYGIQAYEPLPNVTYLDHTNDITEVYKRTKVLLVPSRYESYGRVAVEAAASGIPSICTPTEGLVEAMQGSAAYAEYGDYDAWNDRLSYVLGDLSTVSGYAKERSAFLHTQTRQELEAVDLMFQIIHEGGLQDFYDYKQR